MQGHTTLKVWLVLVVVFVLGTLTGAFTIGAVTGFYHAMARSDRNAPHDRFEKMRRDLNLKIKQSPSTQFSTRRVMNIIRCALSCGHVSKSRDKKRVPRFERC